MASVFACNRGNSNSGLHSHAWNTTRPNNFHTTRGISDWVLVSIQHTQLPRRMHLLVACSGCLSRHIHVRVYTHEIHGNDLCTGDNLSCVFQPIPCANTSLACKQPVWKVCSRTGATWSMQVLDYSDRRVQQPQFSPPPACTHLSRSSLSCWFWGGKRSMWSSDIPSSDYCIR